MINEKSAKAYCCDDFSLIENYELAVNDTTQTWDCHHRRESIYSAKDLIEIGEYWKRPAAELIFLTHSEHRRLHAKGVPLSEEHKKAIGEARKGVPLSDATKKAISDAMIGIPKPYLKGVPKSEEHRAKLSKKILQFTKSGEFLREWQSAMEASRQLKINRGNICGCCNEKLKSAGGYIWKYA